MPPPKSGSARQFVEGVKLAVQPQVSLPQQTTRAAAQTDFLGFLKVYLRKCACRMRFASASPIPRQETNATQRACHAKYANKTLPTYIKAIPYRQTPHCTRFVLHPCTLRTSRRYVGADLSVSHDKHAPLPVRYAVYLQCASLTRRSGASIHTPLRVRCVRHMLCMCKHSVCLPYRACGL